MDLPAILFLFLRNFYRSSTATPVAIDMTVVVQDMLLCFLFTDLYGFSMKIHSQEEEDPSHDQDQDWEEKWNHHCSFCTDSWNDITLQDSKACLPRHDIPSSPTSARHQVISRSQCSVCSNPDTTIPVVHIRVQPQWMPISWKEPSHSLFLGVEFICSVNNSGLVMVYL